MSKIYSILFLAAGVLGFTSCSDDTDNPYDTPVTISVVKSNVSFEARGGQGTISFTSTSTPTVTTTKSWCVAQVAGDSVVVTVPQNNTINDRSAMVTIHNGTDSVNVPVTQFGAFVQVGDGSGIGVTTDEAFSQKYSIDSNVDIQLVSAPDWVNAVIENDSLTVNVEPNNTGNLRFGYLNFKANDFAYSVKVVQADFDKDIAGSYRLYYKMQADGNYSRTNVTLSSKALTMQRFTIPISYEPTTGKLKIQSGQYVGIISDRLSSGRRDTSYVFLTFATNTLADGRYYWSSYYEATYATASIDVAEDGSIEAHFTGNISGYELTRFMFRKFSKKEMSEANDKGSNWMEMYSPYLRREGSCSAKGSYILR